MANVLPCVRAGALAYRDGAQGRLVPLASQAWQEWLAQPGRLTFRFEEGPLRFSARREQQRGGSY